ncbi:c-type cytochrome [Roseomonas sp. E05]|uniref:c-type cytochrome n=1 Tax=Roseomonas sp. E05 TaxID=3046310 RepID=UPI0024B92864|nr:c-type cytochrome [Roseomonas sp. E05]MDJ0387486.1 c-type cytochrome [Roseomonas sp. E05]
MMRGTILAATLLAATTLATAARADSDNFTELQRGRYLTTAGDCMGCHIGPDGQSMAGGNLLETPFGNIAVPNITPDNKTGIGTWSAQDFYEAMHVGKRPDGTHLYPAFPYTSFTKMSRADTDAVYAYLRAQEPVANEVDRNTLPFPFNIRLAMWAWNRLNFTPGEFKPDPQRSEAYNRGAYLVEGPGHCGLCHTPRNFMGGDAASDELKGGALQGWFAPNITADKHLGIGAWSEAEIVDYLRTGHTARTAASGPMSEVVAYSTSQMTDADLKAIATYLRERSAVGAPAPQPVASTDPHMQAGAAIYEDSCAACHARDGQGVAGMFPRLADNQLVQQTDPSGILHVVLQGSRSVAAPQAVTAPAMPSLRWRLSDQQVADVATFIRNSWGNAAAAVTTDQVKTMRDATAGIAMSQGN